MQPDPREREKARLILKGGIIGNPICYLLISAIFYARGVWRVDSQGWKAALMALGVYLALVIVAEVHTHRRPAGQSKMLVRLAYYMVGPVLGFTLSYVFRSVLWAVGFSSLGVFLMLLFA
jgi:hypothetical protein